MENKTTWAAMVQAELITGFYHCDNCERTVRHVRRQRGYWLCAQCWSVIVPDWEQISVGEGQRRDPAWYAETQAQRDRIDAYWQWYYTMKERRPSPKRRSRSELYQSYRQPAALETDNYWPLCECGTPREPLRFAPGNAALGLFGGPFRRYCSVCDAKRDVEAVYSIIGIHPDWDDEQWLDSLQLTHPHAFALGVLPEYWFQLRYPELFDNETALPKRIFQRG